VTVRDSPATIYLSPAGWKVEDYGVAAEYTVFCEAELGVRKEFMGQKLRGIWEWPFSSPIDGDYKLSIQLEGILKKPLYKRLVLPAATNSNNSLGRFFTTGANPGVVTEIGLQHTITNATDVVLTEYDSQDNAVNVLVKAFPVMPVNVQERTAAIYDYQVVPEFRLKPYTKYMLWVSHSSTRFYRNPGLTAETEERTDIVMGQCLWGALGARPGNVDAGFYVPASLMLKLDRSKLILPTLHLVNPIHHANNYNQTYDGLTASAIYHLAHGEVPDLSIFVQESAFYTGTLNVVKVK
jgi:hypothetical protein